MQPPILSLCDLTGNMVRPWADAGFPCYVVDIQHPPGYSQLAPNITAIGADVRFWSQYEHHIHPGIVFAFPPCTHLASSGARWFAAKGLRPFIDALQVVERCRVIAEYCGCPWMIENPVGRLSTAWRKPDHTFEPKRVEPIDGSRMHFVPPGPNRQNIRSETPMGFARAVLEANTTVSEA